MTAVPTVKTLWIGKELSTIERLCLNSFLKHGHKVDLFSYGSVAGIPAGVNIRDGNEILSEDKIFTYKHRNSVAPFADWFRYEMLRQEGGIWIDADVICLRAFDFSDPLIFGAEDSEKFGNAVIGDQPGTPLMELMSSMSSNPHTPMPWDSGRTRRAKWVKRNLLGNRRGDTGWGAAGPTGFTSSIKHLGLEAKAQSVKAFYPIHWRNWRAIFDETYPDPDRYFPDTYALHVWNEMLRREGVDKDASFSQKSLIEELKRRYLD